MEKEKGEKGEKGWRKKKGRGALLYWCQRLRCADREPR